MMNLPALPRRRGAEKLPLRVFGGLDRREAAGNGAIRDMGNLTGADAPVLSSRPKRRRLQALTKPHGVFSAGRLFIADGTTLTVEGDETAYTVEDSDKVFAALGERVAVFPDKKLWTPEGGLVDLEASVTVSAAFTHGTCAGEAADANTIRASDDTFDWSEHFRVGDAVTVTGAADEENNKTPIVREIEGNELRFYENTFTVNETPAEITVSRTVPDMDFLCTNENRIWGCKGDTVYASKLGDPFNWNVFDGISTDSWSVETGSPGDFTGCAAFMGYPVFFKEDRVFKVYGDRPGNFQMMGSATLGVLAGADRTLAVAGETLCYLSRAGWVRYAGGFPSAVDAPLDAAYSGGAAGSDGLRLFVSARRKDGGTEFLVYDPKRDLWHREDDLSARRFLFHGGALYAVTADALMLVGDAPEAGTEEDDFVSYVTFADWDLDSFASKYPVRLWLRAESEGTLTAELSYDGGDFLPAASFTPGAKSSRYLPVSVRRCDRFALRLSAEAPWKLYALQIETRAERTNRKGG